MNVLLDECIPRKLKYSLAGHDCRTASEVGLAGRKNGDVLSVAERLGFDIFVTMDKGVEYEQNLAGRKIGIIILRSRSNRLVDLLPHVPACLALMGSIQPGQVERLGG